MKFLSGTSGIKFLFDEEIAEYVHQTIWHLAVELETLESVFEGLPIGDERTKNVHRRAEIKKKLNAEFGKLEKKFEKYLRLQH